MQGENVTTQRSVQANGYRIHLREAGSGPLVVMLHGFPETSYSFRHQLPALAAVGYHGVALDMLGGGRSSKPLPRDSYRITEIVRTVVGVVEALGEGTAIVVGHDWGAPAAWACAWTRPDVFPAVLGASVPFGGRHMLPWPGCTTSDLPPSELRKQIAGPGKFTYQDYFSQPGVVNAEADLDMRWFFEACFHGISAAGGAPPWSSIESDQDVLDFLHSSALIMSPGQTFATGLSAAEELPDWLPEEDLEVFVAEYEFSGLDHLLNRYRLADLDWELLAPFEGRPLEVPALYVGGDRDVSTLWGREALLRMDEFATDAREPILIEDCGHWVQQEKPEEFNRALLDFLGQVAPVAG